MNTIKNFLTAFVILMNNANVVVMIIVKIKIMNVLREFKGKMIFIRISVVNKKILFFAYKQ